MKSRIFIYVARGFGRCHVEKWQIWRFDLQKLDELKKWLKFEHWTTDLLPSYQSYSAIAQAFQKVSILSYKTWQN